MKKASFVNSKGERHEVDLDATLYKRAHDSNMTVPQLINTEYDADMELGSAFDQMCASVELYQAPDKKFGLRPPTMGHILEGTMEAGSVVRDAQPASRILFPAATLELVEDKLKVDRQSAPAIFDSLIASDTTVAGSRVEQPVISYAGPEAARSQAISQLSEPASMLSITVADTARKIPTFSLGMEMSREALQATTLDLVSLAISRQAEVERAARVDEYINALLNGDPDNGQAALPTTASTTYDSGLAAGTLSQLAWIKYLYHNSNKRTIDWVICDLATAMAIENRTGKPVVTADDPNSPRIDALSRIVNPGWQDVKIFLVEDGVVPANTVMGLDSRYAIQKIRNSEAEYSAVEEFVMRKSTALRFDFGEIVYRIFDDAFDVMTF